MVEAFACRIEKSWVQCSLGSVKSAALDPFGYASASEDFSCLFGYQAPSHRVQQDDGSEAVRAEAQAPLA